MPRHPPRAEVVGSLLRPAGFDSMSPDDKDEAVARVIRQQIDIGLDVVSDGELRRGMFMDSFWGAVSGWDSEDNPITFRDARGSTITWQVQRIVDRLSRRDNPAVEEVRFLSSVTDYPFKVTFPAASLFALPFTFKPGVNDHAYRDLDELVAHAVEIERELVQEAIDAGAAYVQFDFPAYPYLVDPAWVDAIEKTGFSREGVLELALASDRTLRDSLPDGVTRALHLCRGNNRSRYLCEGPLDDVAEAVFGLGYDTYLVEWEDRDRMGDFRALDAVPRDLERAPLVAMGLVSSTRPDVEPLDAVLSSMDEAAEHLPWEQLAISTQCGFASTSAGNEITEDDQWRKLELVSQVAVKLWG